jgi:hypothetical protein
VYFITLEHRTPFKPAILSMSLVLFETFEISLNLYGPQFLRFPNSIMFLIPSPKLLEIPPSILF